VLIIHKLNLLIKIECLTLLLWDTHPPKTVGQGLFLINPGTPCRYLNLNSIWSCNPTTASRLSTSRWPETHSISSIPTLVSLV